MRGPNTYTTEDTVELSCHGGPVPVRETLRAVLAAGARPAEPGEFTLRAFLNGRLDLTQAEAVLNVVAPAPTKASAWPSPTSPVNSAGRIAPARDALVSLLAYLDAAADFPDDEIPVADVGDGPATAEEDPDRCRRRRPRRPPLPRRRPDRPRRPPQRRQEHPA